LEISEDKCGDKDAKTGEEGLHSVAGDLIRSMILSASS
jgi:hypothetical protein